jgi:hypothetical protein
VVKASQLGLNPGDLINGFVSGVSQSTDPGAIVGAGATALYDQMPDSLSFTGTYTVNANSVCAPNRCPVAALDATSPASGNAPLTVNFTGATSSDPDSGDAVASYTFNFGDGSPVVTQASPIISHTYNSAGDYGATLRVTDSHGLISCNTSQVVIHVTSPPQPGQLKFSSATYSVSENGGSATITVTRVNGSSGAVSVQYATSNGTATAGSDYTGTSGTLNFANGDTSKTFSVPVADDALDESDETVNLTLSNATGGATLGSPSTAVLTIVDNDPQPSLTINDVSANEGNSGTTNFTFTVTLSAASGQSVTVNYAAADGTASQPSDYQAQSGLLTFTPGQTSQTVTVLVNGDAAVEPNETFNVNLSSATNATIADAQGVGTILNDDAPTTAVFQFDSSAYPIQEGVTMVSVRVIRTGVTTTAATVDVISNDGTAKQKGDYEIVLARLSFAAGETQKALPILINDDSYVESAESASLVLQNPTNGALGTPSTATLQILDNASEPTTNVIDDSRTFVGTHYHDFLYRQSDISGEDFWTNIIEQCGADAECRRVKRVAVSGAFFLSIEFRQTGYLVIRAHKAAFVNNKGMPRYDTFLRDQHEIGDGIIVGQGNWQAQLAANKQAYLQDFVSRSEFTSKPSFAPGVAAGTYVDALFANSGVTPTTAERDAAISAYGSGDTAGRANALSSVIESGSVFNKLYNDSFVLMQYFGYLRRNPDSSPDTDFTGYDFWLAKLNGVSVSGEDMRDDTQAQHRAERAEMIRAFIESTEYRERFGGRSSGNQLAEPDEGSVALLIKTMIRFAFFGQAS